MGTWGLIQTRQSQASVFTTSKNPWGQQDCAVLIQTLGTPWGQPCPNIDPKTPVFKASSSPDHLGAVPHDLHVHHAATHDISSQVQLGELGLQWSKKDKMLLKGGRDTNTRTQTQNLLRLECAFPSFFIYFFFLWGNWRSNYSWFALRNCRSIYGSHTSGVKAHRIRLIAVISTERIKNEQAEKCTQERIRIIKKR